MYFSNEIGASCVLALDIIEELSLDLDTEETRVLFNTVCLLGTATSPVGWPLFCR